MDYFRRTELLTLSDLYGLQKDLVSERQTLTSERGRQTRLGKSVTEQTNLEAQELLRLFGVPYVVSPGEAESQCVCLELLGLTQGTITDDSDAWLFGACKVYKNFFNQTKYIEFFSADTIYQSFGLDRHKLINLALLCGSDYTPGIPGVGPVRAMEVLAEFPGEGLDSLKAFREWWEDAKNGILPRNLGKAKNKLRTLQLHEGFPSQQVVDAYLHPAVDESEETFTWGVPDLDLLRQFARKKFGWERQKSDSILEPMMKELTKKMTQGRIHSYFHPENFLPPKQVQSKRLQKALDKFQGRQSSESETGSESGSESASESESTGSEPALSKPDESVMKKANQILSGSPRCKGQKVTSRGACRGKKRGKSDGPGSSDRQVTEDKVFEPELFKPGESVIKKANQILSGTPGIKGKKTDGRGNSQGKRGGKSHGQKPPNRRGAADMYGKGSKPTRIIKQGLLKDELCLSESSSSSDEVSHAFKTNKRKVLPEQRVTKPHQLPQQKSKSSGPMSLETKKKPKTTPNVKKITLAIPKPPHKIKSKGNVKGAVINTAVENIAAFKEAMGGSLNPTEMTIDDLGSDFSDND